VGELSFEVAYQAFLRHTLNTMMHLSTAKILLYIALALAPKGAHTIYATSNSENYVWTSSSVGWDVDAKGFPSSDFTRDPSREATFSGRPTHADVPHYLWAIDKHHWGHNSIMVFDNGDRVEKRGNHGFFIINAGGPNEKVFTILFPKDD